MEVRKKLTASDMQLNEVDSFKRELDVRNIFIDVHKGRKEK